MTADTPEAQPAPRSLGFHAYADDTPRREWDDSDPPAMYAAPQSAAIRYDDDIDDDIDEPAAPEPPSPSRAGWPWGKAVAVGGLLVAVAGGLWLGRGAETPVNPEVAPAVGARADATSPAMRIELATVQPAAPPPPPGRDRLEVLTPGGSSTATLATPTAVGAGYALSVRPVAVERETAQLPAPAPEPPQHERAPAASASDAAARGPDSATSFDCAQAPSPARAMVCADRRLAALDQRMKRAYAAALDAGLPEDELREDQADWLDIREDASRYSRDAVASIYRQRIRELERAADGYH